MLLLSCFLLLVACLYESMLRPCVLEILLLLAFPDVLTGAGLPAIAGVPGLLAFLLVLSSQLLLSSMLLPAFLLLL